MLLPLDLALWPWPLPLAFYNARDASRGSRDRLKTRVRRLGYLHVAGVDEVGRGCLAGPVVAGAVVLRAEHYVVGVADSKVLSAEDRERLYDQIIGASVAWTVVDRRRGAKSIASTSTKRRSRRCGEAVMALVPLPGFVLVDGFRIPDLLMAQRHDHRRRSQVDGDCRRVDPRQGHARSADGRTARAGSALRLRPPQGIRDARPSRRRRPLRLFARPPPDVSTAVTV